MIRINLMPEARSAAAFSSSVQVWGVAYLLSGFAMCVVLFLVHLNGASALEEQRAKNSELERQIKQVKEDASDLGEIEARLAKSRQLESVANQLQNARQGPTRLLMELSRILSPGRGPTVDPEVLEQLRNENPLAGYNPGWDVRRLTLTSFREDGGRCQVTGMGKTNEDVAEFLRRLSLSEVFDDVVLQSTTAQSAKEGQAPRVSFELTCKVRY